MTRKILTSNLSFEEQNYKIRNEIKEGEIYNLSFLNKNLEGLKSNDIAILTQSNVISKKYNPSIIISSSLLKKVFCFAKKGVDRNINFKINKDEIEINDILYNNKVKVKCKIFLSLKSDFIINTRIFSIFKLNLKTINNKSIIYIFDTFFVYENIRGEKTCYYLKEN